MKTTFTTPPKLELVSRDSVLLKHNLTPQQLSQLLKALHCQTYRLETRWYLRRSAKRLIDSLFAQRLANTLRQDYLDALLRTTFLYKCSQCGDLRFSPDVLLGEQQLTHSCLLEKRSRRDLLGHLELVGSGPLQTLVEQHYHLFPIETELDLDSAA